MTGLKYECAKCTYTETVVREKDRHVACPECGCTDWVLCVQDTYDKGPELRNADVMDCPGKEVSGTGEVEDLLCDEFDSERPYSEQNEY